MKNLVLFLQNRDFFGAQINHIPLLLELKKRYPKHKIIIFSKHQVSTILKSLNLVDDIVFETSKLTTMKKYLAFKPDVTINLRKKSSLINFYISMFNYNTKIGFKTPLTKIFFTQTKEHNPTIYRAKNYLNLLNRDFDTIKTDTEKRVTIIAGAGRDFKIWDIKNFITLAEKLKKRYTKYEICFVLGEKELELKKEVEKTEFPIYYNLEINQLFKLISTSKLTIANDCGPSHIAQISSNNNIILYSDELNDANIVIKEWFNPKKNSHFIIGEKNRSINSITIDTLFNTAIEVLETR